MSTKDMNREEWNNEDLRIALAAEHEHKFLCPDQQQCDQQCWKSHACRICGQTRESIPKAQIQSEPVADGGGLPKPYVVTKEDEEQAKVVPSEIARPFVAKLVACERALASSQEALRLAREENERLQARVRQLNLAFALSDAILPAEFEPELPPTKRLHAYIAKQRERMQQAVDLLSNMDPTHQLWKVSKAISLLSPEGSSR
jgi:hypothetical protein